MANQPMKKIQPIVPSNAFIDPNVIKKFDDQAMAMALAMPQSLYGNPFQHTVAPPPKKFTPLNRREMDEIKFLLNELRNHGPSGRIQDFAHTMLHFGDDLVSMAERYNENQKREEELLAQIDIMEERILYLEDLVDDESLSD